ncbi:MAG: alpha/beta hydrolase domain-containing protein [Vicinamibacterales bacterium]
MTSRPTPGRRHASATLVLLHGVLFVLLGAAAASADLVRVEVLSRKDFGTYERVSARVHFAVDPALGANRAVVDLALAPRNADGMVEFWSDLLLFRPTGGRAHGTVFLEPVNRGREQSLGLLSGAEQGDLLPESWTLGDRFLLEQGFTVAFLGWQFDVRPSQGLTFHTPSVAVEGVVRSSFVGGATSQRATAFGLSYCAAHPTQVDAQLTFRTRIDQPARLVPRDAWQFGPGGCSVQLAAGFDKGVYDAIYQSSGSPVAGLGLAALRDFAAYLKHGPDGGLLREHPAELRYVMGFGYSQSARVLRELVRDGFNADETGRLAFDGLFIASAGAGVGSFNHRFAVPGDAGNSVLSILRPVDIPPFLDAGLLASSRDDRVTPKIFYTFSATEYWARAGSLTHSSNDGTADASLGELSRLYFLSGTSHSTGPFPPGRSALYQHAINFADPRWVLRALVMDLDAWVTLGTEPPLSRYPTIAKKELVPLTSVRFPQVAALAFPREMPRVWGMDFGAAFATTGVITQQPPVLGRPYRVLVPQADEDGNDRGGVRLPEVAAPLGTYLGWNISVPALPDLQYLAGLVGSFRSFARTEQERDRTGDERLSIAERYADRRDYLARVAKSADDLVKHRFLRGADVRAVLERAAAMWDAIVGR